MLPIRSVIAMLVGMFMAASALADQNLFVVDLANEPASLDPHVQWDVESTWVYRNIFDNLLTRDQAGKIVPQVAASWNNETDTRISFRIQNDIRFHNGSKLTPDDVVFSVHRITDPAFKSPQISQFDAITAAEVIGTDQVTLSTKRAYPVLLAQLTKLSIVPRAVVEKADADAFNHAPLGSGPYRFVSRTQGVKVELAENAEYWRGRPPFSRAEMRPVPNEATRVADVRSTRADLARISSTDTADQTKSAPGVKVLWAPSERVRFVIPNTLAGITRDLRVRAALAHAIDRNLIIEALLKGYARPVDEPIAPESFGFIPGMPGYDYDPAKSKALLKEAGIARGTKITHLTFQGLDQRVVQAVDQMLAEVGLDAEISMVDQPTFIKLKLGAPETAGDFSYQGWSCGCQDADGTLFPLFHSSSPWSKYHNPAFDAIVLAARDTLDAGARTVAYKQALQILHDDVAVIPLYQDPLMFVARKQVEYHPKPDESLFLFEVRWTE
jgi:peptide/nickel transport system substrate-binding protein